MYNFNSLSFETVFLLFVVLASSVVNTQNVTSSSAPPVVETKSGRIQGVFLTLPNRKQVNAFLAIPFAQPPIGELRFKKPVPVERWNGTYLATHNRDSCIQKPMTEITTSEDCLFLNIWQPINQNITSGKLSVMFWIYGGGFNAGSIFLNYYNADYLSTLGDVIVVSTNYRLGAFGFLYGASQEAPGNVGLHDQLLALKWVKDNIASFGGNPNSITIFGESAGAMSVGSHVLSPLSNGLFQRAIIQSGTPNSVIGSRSQDKAIEVTKSLALSLNCTNATVVEQVRCLRNKHAEEILKAIIPVYSFFNPIYGDEFLPTKPSEALKQGKLNQVDLLFGHTKNEGTIFVIDIFLDSTRDKLVINASQAKAFINESFSSFGLPYGIKVADFYLKGLTDKDKKELFAAVADSWGDFHLTCTTVLFGQLAAIKNKNNNSYAYMLAHGPPHPTVGKHLQDVVGVAHADDVYYVFGLPLKWKIFPKVDEQQSSDLINVWTTFAKTGKVPKLRNVTWETAMDTIGSNPHVRYMSLQPQYQMVETGHPICEGFWKPYIE